MWLNLQETADLVTFTEETLNEKLHFCAVFSINSKQHTLFLTYLLADLSINLLHCYIDTWKNIASPYQNINTY